jgi:hypothetical protein
VTLVGALVLFAASAAPAFAQSTVTATWDRNTDSYTTGYRVYYGTSSGSYQWNVDAGNNISVPLTLTAGSLYYVCVRAYNASNEFGPASTEATVDLRAPAPTAQITATLGSNNVATVTWQTANATSATLNGATVALNGTSTFTVTAQTTYTIVARAADGRTATASATVTPTAPAPTAQITATLGSNNVATLTWQTANATSATINGNAVALSGSTTTTVTAQTTFTLTARAADGRTATASATVTPTATPAPTAQISATLQAVDTANGAAGGYTAAVTWQTSNAASATINDIAVALSGSSAVTVTADTTFTLTATAADGRTTTATTTVRLPASTAPGDPRSMAASVSGSRVTLTWQAPTTGGAPTHYLLYVGTRSGYSNVVSAYNVGNVLRVSGDLPRGTYYARVRAANNAGTSLNSNEARFSIGRKLRSPSGFTVTWSGTTATMSWVAPSADSAEDVPTNYVIQAGTTPGASDVAQLSVGNTTRFTTDVPSGNYYVRVIAQNALGESDPSNEIEVRAPGAPQAPTSLMSVSPNGIVDLRWTASAGGYAATGYVIEAGSAPGRADLATLNVGNVTSFQTTAPPGVYYVRVRAINARGMSLPSNEVIVRR